jgi:hypothetical protein
VFVIERHVPLQLPEEFDDPSLLTTRDELLEGAVHGGLLGGLAADAKGMV